MAHAALDSYLDQIRLIRSCVANTPETSYYPALNDMLNLVGRDVKPRVFCLHHPSGGDGIPDFGLFEQTVFPRDQPPAWVAAVTPGRGVVEAKLGPALLDIGMNEASCWASVPHQVWECRIGGYQVLKKWLSYRDHSILQRPLLADEVAHVQATARRIAAVLLLGPALDAAHEACGDVTARSAEPEASGGIGNASPVPAAGIEPATP